MKSFNQYLESREIDILIENISLDLNEMNLDADEFIDMYLEAGFLAGLGNFVKGAWDAGKAGYRQVRDDPSPAINSAQKSLQNLASTMEKMGVPNLSGQLSHMSNFIGGLKNQFQWDKQADPNASQYQTGGGVNKINMGKVMKSYGQQPMDATQKMQRKQATDQARQLAAAQSYAKQPAPQLTPLVKGQPTPDWNIPGVTPKP